MREFRKFDPAPTALKLVSERRALHRPERLDAALLPHPIQRLESRRGKLPSGCRHVEIGVWMRTHELALARPKIPIEFLILSGGPRHQQGVTHGVPIEARRPEESPRQ